MPGWDDTNSMALKEVVGMGRQSFEHPGRLLYRYHGPWMRRGGRTRCCQEIPEICLQHTLSFQLPWRPWAQWTTLLHTISSKTLAARWVKCLVTAEKGRSCSSGYRSQSSVLMWPCSTSHSLGTMIPTPSHSTFAFNFFFVFNPWTYTTRGITIIILKYELVFAYSSC